MKGCDTMPVSKAHMKATAKYNAKAYDRIEIKVKKGEKEGLQALATQQGMSLNAFITAAIDSYINQLKPLTETPANLALDDK